MRTFTIEALGLASVVALVACNDGTTASSSQPSSPNEGEPASTPVATSALSRNTSPNVAASDAEALVAGDTAFAADLYKTLGTTKFAGENLFFSPHSVSVALAMAFAGARGTTESEMAAALHFTLPQTSLHNAMNGLDLALASRGSGAKAADGAPFRLRVTNSIWGQPNMPFEQPFLDTIATNYGAGVRLTDFATDPEASRTTINAWVAKETEDRIEELLGAGSLTRKTRLVLVNAVYFNAAWANHFEPALTRPGTFHAPSGDVTADFMRQTTMFEHARGDGYDVIKLPYDGQELDLVAMVPDAGKLDAFESTLDATKLATITSNTTFGLVELQLPKFKIEGKSFGLHEALGQLGMKQAFDENAADFSGMLTPSVERLYVGDVVHQAFVAVDEKGTEAAAATAVVMAGAPSVEPEKTVLTIDRPFVFGIRDRATGAFVFLGRVMHP